MGFVRLQTQHGSGLIGANCSGVLPRAYVFLGVFLLAMLQRSSTGSHRRLIFALETNGWVYIFLTKPLVLSNAGIATTEEMSVMTAEDGGHHRSGTINVSRASSISLRSLYIASSCNVNKGFDLAKIILRAFWRKYREPQLAPIKWHDPALGWPRGHWASQTIKPDTEIATTSHRFKELRHQHSFFTGFSFSHFCFDKAWASFTVNH